MGISEHAQYNSAYIQHLYAPVVLLSTYQKIPFLKKKKLADTLKHDLKSITQPIS